MCTDEVDDEPPGAVATSVAAEKAGAKGRARDGGEDGVPFEDDRVIARVSKGVAEAEDGLEARDAGRGRDRQRRP